MECWCVSKNKSWFYWLLILMAILILMVCRIQGGCIEEERNALLEIKTSLADSYVLDVAPPLLSWVDDGSIGGECCDWERVTCNTTTGDVTKLSLSNIVAEGCDRIWSLNVSLFLHFKELTSLNLSKNCLDDGIVNTGLGRLSSLKKLEIVDLSGNNIGNDIFRSLGALASLRVLHLDDNYLEGCFPALGMFLFLPPTFLIDFFFGELGDTGSLLQLFYESHMTELADMTNLEELDLSDNRFNDTPSIPDCARLSRLKKLKSIILGYNEFNKSIISCLSALPSLKTLDLSYNLLGGSFPIQELLHLRDLEVLRLSGNHFNGTLPMEALISLHNLEVLDLSKNYFVGSIPSTIHAFSSLRVVSFAYNNLSGLIPDHGLCELKNLHELDLSHNKFHGSLPQCFRSLSSLKLLDISSNRFTGIHMSSVIATLTSLEYIDFSGNKFEGSFSFSSFSNHTNLEVVRFICENGEFEVETEEPTGWIPVFQLKVLVLSSCNINRPKGSVVPGFLLHQRKLQVIDLSHNSVVGQFPSWLIENNTKLEVLNLRNNSVSGKICMPWYTNANTRWLDVSQNHMNGVIPSDLQKLLPKINYLNLSSNSLDGIIPSSIGDMREIWALDLSNNKFSGEVPKGLLTNLSYLSILKLSKNRLHGEVLSGNSSLGNIESLGLDNNYFTGKIGKGTVQNRYMRSLDISNNFFTGMIPRGIGNMSALSEFVVRDNSLAGTFPCGTTSFSFLDISQNSFSGPISSCLNLQYMIHLHLGSNKFNGSIPDVFRNLTDVLTLDIGDNFLSGKIPNFIGELSNLRVLILRNNNFSGFIPKQLCQLSNLSLIDLSSNSLTSSIPRCLHNIGRPIFPSFTERNIGEVETSFYDYRSVLYGGTHVYSMAEVFEIEDEVRYTTKTLSLSYKGRILDYMVGLDLSCNKITGEIPEELGLLTEIHSLNLSHNRLSGSIPMQLSNLELIESLDLSSNGLSGKLPSQLIRLTSLAIFNVSYNNLSGRLPDVKAQFSTFTKASYEGNPFLCGPPLEKKCTATSQGTHTLTKEGTDDKWYDIDMTFFYGSFCTTWVVFLLGFGVLLYTNPYLRRRWLDLVEEYICMHAITSLMI
ncbi:receptor-like protein 15 [Cynara cardunculus var. scolymus]|uniref:receptor-like protein 15 n=1 Tax=Cynara cardunculus var. scolymus TaxID=59895 RepID=UPI000D63145D|nr:receptor-like protein 15 [Cynara cardunculus var. scolymus]